MIYGIGTDIVEIERMRRSLERHGERFARRILGNVELEEFAAAAAPASFLAKRFAAKEAAAKALGTGFRDGLTLPQIEVSHDPLGRPLLNFTGAAAALVDSAGVAESYLSISDEHHYAVAFVTLTRRG